MFRGQKYARTLLTALTLAGLAGCAAEAPDAVESTRSALTTASPAYLYFRCNSTGWNVDAGNRMVETSTPGVYAVDYDVVTSWMTTTGDDCELTQTSALDSWGVWQKRYGYSTTFVVPGTRTFPEAVNIDAHFKARYPSLGRYRARFNLNTLELNIDVAQAPDPAPVLQDLGAMNAPFTLNSSSGMFKISQLPSGGFNVVTLVIQAKDGKDLEGQVSGGGRVIALEGTSQIVRFRERGTQPALFDLAFPGPRIISLTWYVEDRVPESKAITRTVQDQGANVLATYGFAADHALDNDVSLTFAKSSFVDGEAPTVTRLAHNPQGVRYPNRPDDLNGPTYDIHAKLAPGARVQVALPVPDVALLQGIEESAITIMHYNAGTQVWTEIIPDKIVDGYVYFTTDSFSSFFSRMARRAKKIYRRVVHDLGDAAVQVYDMTVTFVDGVRDAVREGYEYLVKKFCSALDFNTYKKIFYGEPTFRAPQANLTEIAQYPNAQIDRLKVLDAGGLILLSTAAGATQAERELAQWKISKLNADLILNDVVLAARGVRARRFSAQGSSSQGLMIYDRITNQRQEASMLFRFSSSLLASAPRVLELLQICDGAAGLADEFAMTTNRVTSLVRDVSHLNLSGVCYDVLMMPVDFMDWVTPDILSCTSEAAAFESYYRNHNLGQYWTGARDSHLIGASEFLNVFSLLAWTDVGFRDAFNLKINALRNEVHSFVGLTRELYGDNNIVIKAMAGVSFWDMVSKGDKGTYATLKSCLEGKTGPNGGYAEGMGYLQYVNDDVPYLLASMLRAGFITRAELPANYVKSGEWLFNASHSYAVGNGFSVVPADVDDGVPKTPDFFVYTYLTGDGRYRRLATDNTVLSQITRPIQALGLTNQILPMSAPPALPKQYFADGVGVIRAGSASLVISAESGTMRVAGGGHDQQDALSVSMKRAGADVIIDPGYAGFESRNDNTYARFDNHNVVMTADAANFHGESANGKVTYGDIAYALSKQPGVYNLDWITSGSALNSVAIMLFSYMTGSPMALAWDAIRSGWNNLMSTAAPGKADGHAGGSDAVMVGALITEASSPAVPAYGMELKHRSTAGVTDRRLILSFADHFWIIDRPDVQQALWSRTHWAVGAVGTAFQLPQGAVIGDDVVTITQNDDTATVRTMQRRTLAAGAPTSTPPVFITAVPVEAGQISTFAAVPCVGATCMRRMTATGDDLVIVPSWGVRFVDAGQFFKDGLSTGQVILAHRNAGATAWSYRLLGDTAVQSHGYEVVTTAASWTAARDACAARGAHLAIINSAAENAAVQGLAAGMTHVWIGLSKTTSTWTWTDGSALSYANWGDGEPNNMDGTESYVELYTPTGIWNDLPASWQLPFLCERD